ncbi:MAG: DUF4178 domain-containing protein [Planctomycetes bacterium]|nr:DUF4178 domain-containing protein [Planctomycetota bacterium]
MTAPRGGVEVSCPGCGAPIRFEVGSSVVRVCARCGSAVARGDRDPEDLGKVAALADTGSRLALGLRGRREGVGFQVVGHVQLEHPAGGTWDEWYAAFSDGRWGWLAEAQGKLYLTFAGPPAAHRAALAWERLRPGELVPLELEGGPFVVAEAAEAAVRGAEGEIPYRLEPGETYRYADLSGPGGAFATLQYGEGPEDPVEVYIGREVSPEDLELGEAGGAAERRPRQVEGVHLACPSCGGALEVRVPDRTERVGCPSCGALLDASQGTLRFLKLAGPPAKGTEGGAGHLPRPAIPLGSKGTLDGLSLTVIGFLLRSTEVGGTRYRWTEHLLHEPEKGFWWLVCSDGHWSLVRSVPPGSVTRDGQAARREGRRFRYFQGSIARVDAVLGELYWKVEVGEAVRATDFVRPPEILSEEVTAEVTEAAPEEAAQLRGKKARRREKRRTRLLGEVQWSHGRYVRPEEVEAAFGVKVPRPKTVGLNEPFRHGWVYRPWGLFGAALVLVGLVFWAIAPRRQVFEARYDLNAMTTPESRIVFTDPLELDGSRNVRVTVETDASNSWLYLQGDLVREASDEVRSFAVAVERYHGVEGGEAWSEGSPAGSVYLSAVEEGRYTLRLELERGGAASPSFAVVRVEQGAWRALNLLLALGGISVLPVLVGLYHIGFEKRRWEGSDAS